MVSMPTWAVIGALAAAVPVLVSCASPTPTPTTPPPTPTPALLNTVPLTPTPEPRPEPTPTATPMPPCDLRAPYDVAVVITQTEGEEVLTQHGTFSYDDGDGQHRIFDHEGNVEVEYIVKDGVAFARWDDSGWERGYGWPEGYDTRLGPCAPILHPSGYYVRGDHLYSLTSEQEIDGETVRGLEFTYPEDAGYERTIYVGPDDRIRQIVEVHEEPEVELVMVFSGYSEPNTIELPVNGARPTPTPGQWGSREFEVTPLPPTPTPTPRDPTPTPEPTFGECDCDGRIPVEEIYAHARELLIERLNPIKVTMSIDSAVWGSDKGEWTVIANTCNEEGLHYESSFEGTWDADCSVDGYRSRSSRIAGTCLLE